jgi:hypothetical protein
MINSIRYYLLLLIDWKISLLQKFKKIVSGEYKYIKTDNAWISEYKKWKKQND